jgi:hypothetical protein
VSKFYFAGRCLKGCGFPYCFEGVHRKERFSIHCFDAVLAHLHRAKQACLLVLGTDAPLQDEKPSRNAQD